jgi:hypothetical protein
MISGLLPLPEDVAEQVEAAEYARLLDYPTRVIPDGRVRERAEESRRWYSSHGRPWAHARTVEIEEIAGPEIRLVNGEVLGGSAPAGRFGNGDATAIVAAGVSAGAGVDERSKELWRQDRPDEAYFLDRFAAAVVEHLARWAGEWLRRLAGDRGLGLLPGISPGHEGWDVAQQDRVARCLTADGAAAPPGFEVLASGMIRPRSSLLTVFALTPEVELAKAAWRRRPCSWCSLSHCGFRRLEVAG